MSRVTALVLLLVYGAYLYFQLGSHSDFLSERCCWRGRRMLWGVVRSFVRV